MTYQTFDSCVLYESVLADELGHLYRAGELTHDGVQRRVWLRVFDADQIPARKLVECLEEANLIGESLQGTDLVTNPRFFEHDGTPAMAWDYVPGQPLAAVLERSDEAYSPFSTASALLLVRKLCSALATGLTVEVRGDALVHGFLHPALVVATNDGQILLSGFGFASRLIDVVDNPEKAGALLPYLAPEVITSRVTSKRADVYSLGVILLRLLTGKALPARPSDRDSAVREAVLADGEQPLPEEIRGLLERALDPVPEKRFSSAVELNEALTRLMGDDAFGHGPSTFDLAVVMYELFRSEVEAEENLGIAESEIDLEPLLAPEIEEVEEVELPSTVGRGGKGVWIGVASAVVAVAFAAFFIVRQLLSPVAPAPALASTPTPEELEAQKQADTQRIAVMVDAELSRLMAQKEEEITQELMARQSRIDDLRRQLEDASRKRTASGAGPTRDEQRQAEKLRREIEAEEEAKRQREAELARQRREAEEEARQAREAALARAQSQLAEEAPPELGSPQAASVAQTSTPIRMPATPPPAAPDTASESGLGTTGRPAEEVVTRPVKISGPAPVYPEAANRKKVGGDVVLEVSVDEKGKVRDIRVVQGQPMGLTRAATQAVKRWRFEPATKNGTPVEAVIELKISFVPP